MHFLISERDSLNLLFMHIQIILQHPNLQVLPAKLPRLCGGIFLAETEKVMNS